MALMLHCVYCTELFDSQLKLVDHLLKEHREELSEEEDIDMGCGCA
jgi:hypothetical protein